MGEVETVIMETLSVEVTCQLPAARQLQLSQHQAFQAGFWFEIPVFFTHPVCMLAMVLHTTRQDFDV